MRRLAVSLDGVAALRAASGAGDVELSAAAVLAELAGADAIEVGVSESLAPVSEADVYLLRRTTRSLELRLAPAPALLKLALEAQPQRVVLAGQSGPLDLRAWGSALAPAARTLREAGIVVAARVAPDPAAVKAAHAADVEGVDLHVASVLELPGSERQSGLERLADAARLAIKLRLSLGLAGGLDRRTLPAALEAAPATSRVTVGRAFAAQAILLGVERAVRDLRERLG